MSQMVAKVSTVTLVVTLIALATFDEAAQIGLIPFGSLHAQ
jgi:hypothetical protein